MEQQAANGSVPPPMPAKLPGIWPTYGSSPTPAPKRTSPWVWVAVVAGLFVVIAALVGIGSVAFKSFAANGRASTQLVGKLHDQMTKKDWDGIYADTAPRYREVMTRESHDAMFGGIDRKIGAPLSTTQVGIFMNTDASGQYLRGTFQTRFALDATATETITWKMVDGTYRIQAYKINSDALVTR